MDLTERDSTLQVELGDNAKYAVKAVGTASFQPECRDSLHMRDVLFILGLKNNLLLISALEDRGYKVAFVDGTLLQPANSRNQVWSRCNSMVLSWLLNFISKEIAASIIYIDIERDMWLDLKDSHRLSSTVVYFSVPNGTE